MPSGSIPKRPVATLFTLLALWIVFYASFTLFTPALLDDADSVHAEVAREMLVRHDYTTLYANGIRYLEKAPLLYWSMAASMRVAQLLGHPSARCLAVAARLPLALTVLALAFAVESFARRAFRSARAGLYAALILLSSPGIFLFTRILLPDAMLCLWLTLAMLCFWLTEQGAGNREQGTAGSAVQTVSDEPDGADVRVPHSSRSHRDPGWDVRGSRRLCFGFAACCALGVLTKGLIGLVFPVAIVAIYLLLTRGIHGAVARIRQLHLLSSLAVFFAIAAPWHIAIALANPAQGNPGGLSFTLHPAAGARHWQIPLPTDGNVHGWAWFYFVNEQLLRYLNLRIPRDYDTVPLWLFWGLCLIWLMPWSAFLFKALDYLRMLFRTGYRPIEDQGWKEPGYLRQVRARLLRPNAEALSVVWAALPLLFFSLSTRQEYYVLPALPPLAILIAGWLAQDSVPWHPVSPEPTRIRRANLRCTSVVLAFGAIFAAAAMYFLLHTHAPATNADLAALLAQNPGDYAMSMGHFMDLNAQALALFRLPLAIAAASLFLGPLVSYILRRRAQPHAATLALAAGAFGFLLAAHLGLQTFAPVLSSQQLAAAIAPQLQPNDLIVVHQEYEFASTLGFYLQRPGYAMQNGKPVAVNPIRILTDASYNGVANYGRSSNLWYGSYFPDAPPVFVSQQTLAANWAGPRRIFLWQDLAGEPSSLPPLPGPIFVLARSGGKEIVSNQPRRP